MTFRSTIRTLLAFTGFVAIAASLAAAGETYDLRPDPQADALSRVEIILQVGGDTLLAAEGKKTSHPLSVVANVSYDEKLIAVTPSEHRSQSLRYYNDARVAIKIDKGGQKPTLRDSRRLISAQTSGGTVTLYSPSGPLLRDELDLIELPASSLIVDGLLPAEPVAIDGEWSHDDRIMASLLGLDAASKVKVKSRLTEVSDGVAKIVLEGTIKGAATGVGTDMAVKAKYNFDLKAKRIDWFALLVKERRAIGHVGPGLDVVAKLIMKVTPIADSVHLSPEITDKLARTSDGLDLLEFESPTGTFRFDYDRRWFVTSEEKNVAILRFVDRGELVAQCNISPLAVVQKQVTLSEFQDEIRVSLGKHFGQFLEAGENTNEAGYRVLRVVASGTVSDLPIQWVYYLLTGPDGARASLSFTMESTLTQRFGAADRAIVGSLRFSPPAAKTATKPTAAR